MRSLTTWTPTNLATFDTALDRIFGDLLRTTPGNGLASMPSADIVEKEDAFLLHVDLPGVKKEDVSISVEDGMLAVRGKRSFEHTEEKDNLVRRERYAGEFTRSFRLGERVNAKAISAKLENGVLVVRVPKAEEAKAQPIQIQ